MKKIRFSLLLCVLFSTALEAQKLTDSNYIYRKELADQYMQKSRGGKIVGYSLLAGGALAMVLAVNSEMNDNSAGGLTFVGCLALAISNPILCGASRNKGKAEMLYMDPVSGETKEAMIRKYRGNATSGSIAAWTLFLGGFAGLFVVAENSGNGMLVPAAIMFSSLPVWMGAARNKGRLMILTGREVIPGNPVGPSSYSSFGVGIPIGH